MLGALDPVDMSVRPASPQRSTIRHRPMASSISSTSPIMDDAEAFDFEYGDSLKSRNARKRRSLNISLDFNWNEKPLITSPNRKPPSLEFQGAKDLRRTHSQRSEKRSMDFENEFAGSKHKKGMNSPANGAQSKRSSFQAVLEQEKMIQHQLQELARSENARLQLSEPAVVSSDTTRDLGIPSGPETRPMSPPSRSSSPAFFPSTTHNVNYFIPSHSRDYSLQSNISSSTDATSPSLVGTSSLSSANSSSTSYTSTSNLATPVASRVKNNSKHFSKKLISQLKKNENGMFIMSPDDLERLQNAAEELSVLRKQQEETEVYSGPQRPGDIGGDALSWQMATDILRLSTFTKDKSLLAPTRSPASSLDVLKFLWATFSEPDNLRDAFHKNQWIPPSDVVNSLKFKIPSPIGMYNLFMKLMCVSVSILVLFIQVILLGIMVVVYVVGDIVLIPGRWIGKTTTSSITGKKKPTEKSIAKKLKKSRVNKA